MTFPVLDYDTFPDQTDACVDINKQPQWAQHSGLVLIDPKNSHNAAVIRSTANQLE